ncbi:hypothetical protein MUB04_15265 [Acinetobacter indicus]|uniref:hypothetical protein n=1 Tax=Acinetobacter TaxID=469 RepID=UPI0015D1D54A|nr:MULTISPECIES: hypothetical protein [Acinetobacter]MCP0917895.1 hypothetical protein [Acinetobacter indicus]
MILYNGELPRFNFNLDGYSYFGELSEDQYEGCQLIFMQKGFYDFPEQLRANKISGSLRCLVNVKTKEIRAFTVATQMRLCARNLFSYEHNDRFFFPIEMLKADDVKKAVRAHILACLFSFQNEIIEKMIHIEGAWSVHNDMLYGQFNLDDSIDDINPRFFPRPENDIYDVFNHTNVGLNAMGKRIIEAIAMFCSDYELPYAQQLKELLSEFELPLIQFSCESKQVA